WQGGVEVEGRFKLFRRQPLCNVRIAGDQVAEVSAVIPCAHRVFLNDAVGVLTQQPGLRQIQQDLATENQPASALEISEHPVRIYNQRVNQDCSFVQQIVRENRGVGQDHPFH